MKRVIFYWRLETTNLIPSSLLSNAQENNMNFASSNFLLKQTNNKVNIKEFKYAYNTILLVHNLIKLHNLHIYIFILYDMSSLLNWISLDMKTNFKFLPDGLCAYSMSFPVRIYRKHVSRISRSQICSYLLNISFKYVIGSIVLCTQLLQCLMIDDLLR